VCVRVAALLLCLAAAAAAQRVFEDHGAVVYQDASGARQKFGSGFDPLLMSDGKVAFIHGRKFSYGEKFDCSDRNNKNWIDVYDPVAGSRKVLFDRALRFGQDIAFCVFTQMQLSPDDSILYLVSSVGATAGSLAIVQLKTGAASFVGGVNYVYVIDHGPHRGELIYQQRRPTPTYMGSYPWVHARADGKVIKVLVEEDFLKDVPFRAPRLATYLREIEGSINIDGQPFP
jgi:hypothetical protein